MDAANFFMTHPEIKRGAVRILFTPDEEIGRGVDRVDMSKLAADFGYTVDGESLGHLDVETFSADAAVLTVTGVSTHPGYAKGKMENSLKIASEIIATLPKSACSPETTSGKEGFVHPTALRGSLEQATLSFILRDFDDVGLRHKEQVLREVADRVMRNYTRSSYQLDVTPQYRNMKQVLDHHPHVVDFAVEAIRKAELTPQLTSIRGGTDGSRLSYMGLPCPNLFAGEHAFHSRQEWVSVQDMHKAVEVIVHLVRICEERAG
jgi:tripeptide aminopeptidase